jgi:hypothetical protein
LYPYGRAEVIASLIYRYNHVHGERGEEGDGSPLFTVL